MFNCPRCAESLSTETVGTVEIEVCPGCGGTWLDAGELKALAAVAEQSGTPADHDESPVDTRQMSTQMCCPKCPSSMLQAFIYAFDSGIELDRCPQCEGVWLDMRELESVIALMVRNQATATVDSEKFAGLKEYAQSHRRLEWLQWLGRLLMRDRYGNFSW